MDQKKKLTAEGYARLKQEIDEIVNVKIPANLNDIAVAREQGDLSENAEYHAAREEQARLNDRLNDLKAQIENAEILKDSEISTDVVSIGSKVVLFDEDMQETVEYTIVNKAEASLKAGKLNIESDVGQAIKGRKVGERVEVKAPAGIFYYQIISISKN